MSAGQTLLPGFGEQPRRTWRNLYRRVRADSVQVSVAAGSDGAVLIGVGQRKVVLESDEVINVEFALRAAREGEP